MGELAEAYGTDPWSVLHWGPAQLRFNLECLEVVRATRHRHRTTMLQNNPKAPLSFTFPLDR